MPSERNNTRKILPSDVIEADYSISLVQNDDKWFVTVTNSSTLQKHSVVSPYGKSISKAKVFFDKVVVIMKDGGFRSFLSALYEISHKVAVPDKFTETTLLTPPRAFALLTFNHHNREVDVGHMDNIIRAFLAGVSYYSNDAIAMHFAGFLGNGQHRCYAILISGGSLKVAMAYGLNDEDFKNLDSNQKPRRSDGQAEIDKKLHPENYSNLPDTLWLQKLTGTLVLLESNGASKLSSHWSNRLIDNFRNELKILRPYLYSPKHNPKGFIKNKDAAFAILVGLANKKEGVADTIEQWLENEGQIELANGSASMTAATLKDLTNEKLPNVSFTTVHKTFFLVSNLVNLLHTIGKKQLDTQFINAGNAKDTDRSTTAYFKFVSPIGKLSFFPDGGALV